MEWDDGDWYIGQMDGFMFDGYGEFWKVDKDTYNYTKIIGYFNQHIKYEIYTVRGFNFEAEVLFKNSSQVLGDF